HWQVRRDHQGHKLGLALWIGAYWPKLTFDIEIVRVAIVRIRHIDVRLERRKIQGFKQNQTFRMVGGEGIAPFHIIPPKYEYPALAKRVKTSLECLLDISRRVQPPAKYTVA